MGQQQHRPESAGLLDELLDLRRSVLDGAHRADARGVDEVDHLAHVAALDRHLREGGHLLEVAEPLLDAVLDLAVGLLARLGDVHQADEPPLGPVDRGDRAI